jgi:hypothetical protein
VYLYNYSSSPNIIRMLTSRGKIWAGHVARREEGFYGKARRKETTKKT